MNHWIEELTDGIIPTQYLKALHNAREIHDFKEIFDGMPASNLACLEYIMKFLDKLTKYSEVNKFTYDDIPPIFGPTLVRLGHSKEIDIAQMFEAQELISRIHINLHILFPPEVKGYCLSSKFIASLKICENPMSSE
jgi:hypothetical protein